jgi:hypothetical protein
MKAVVYQTNMDVSYSHLNKAHEAALAKRQSSHLQDLRQSLDKDTGWTLDTLPKSYSSPNRDVIGSKTSERCDEGVVVETRRQYKKEHSGHFDDIREQLNLLQFERDALNTERMRLARQLTAREEALSLKERQIRDEVEAAKATLRNKESRNDGIQSQIGLTMKAYDDAKRAEQETYQRQGKGLVVIDALQNELSFIAQQRDQHAQQLQQANSQMTKLFNTTKFFEFACRPCKSKFAKLFRSELIKDRVDVDNLSFVSARSSVVLPNDTANRDTCRCSLM